MRPEVTLALVALEVPTPRRWRTVVCHELLEPYAAVSRTLTRWHLVRRCVRAWRRLVKLPRHRVVSWRRRLHDMEAPIMPLL